MKNGIRPLISVIVPIFNVENYLENCIESIINQTYHNLEIILIDDGSTDEPLLICERFEKKDKRIVVVHQENSGVSCARNKGIDIANGDYICFVDGDDVCSPYMIEILYSLFEEDVILARGCFEEDDKAYGVWPQISGSRVINTKEEHLMNILDNKVPISACVSLYINNKSNLTHFRSNIKHNEDKLFLFEYLMNNEGNVVMTTDVIYKYIKRTGSTTRNGYSNSMLDILEVSRIICKICINDMPKLLENAQVNMQEQRERILRLIVINKSYKNNKSIFRKIKRDYILNQKYCNSLNKKIELIFLKVGDIPFILLIWINEFKCYLKYTKRF